MNRNFALGCLCIAMATLIFSTMEVVLKLPAVAGAFHPIQITMERFLVGGLCLIPVAAHTLKKKGVRLTAHDLRYFAMTGFLNVCLGMVLFQLAVTLGQANVVAVIFSGNPIFVTVLAAIILHEVIRWNNILALVFDLLGILIIVNPFGSGQAAPLSVGLTVLSALLFALYAVLGKKKTARVGSIVVTCCSFLFGSLELCLVLLLGHLEPVAGALQSAGLELFANVPFFQGITPETLPHFLFVGIVNTAAGYVFHMLAIEKTSAIHGSLVFFFKPILAPIFALVILGEAITPTIALGIAMFLAGSLLGMVPAILRNRHPKEVPNRE